MMGRPKKSPDRYGHAKRVDVEVCKTPQWRVISSSIGSKIKVRREDQNIAASELAAALGSCVRVIHRWECGTNPPSLKALYAISQALRCSMRDLLPDSHEYFFPTPIYTKRL